MMLNQDPEMITKMEEDLKLKVKTILDAQPDMRMLIAGVYSVDDLEHMMSSELEGLIGVGIQYNGLQRVQGATASSTANPSAGRAARMLEYSFLIILAVPTQENQITIRHSATKLLTLLRLGVLGKPIGNDGVQRTWDLIAERPELDASSETMLYYSQLWQVAMPNLATA